MSAQIFKRSIHFQHWGTQLQKLWTSNAKIHVTYHKHIASRKLNCHFLPPSEASPPASLSKRRLVASQLSYFDSQIIDLGKRHSSKEEEIELDNTACVATGIVRWWGQWGVLARKRGNNMTCDRFELNGLYQTSEFSPVKYGKYSTGAVNHQNFAWRNYSTFLTRLWS